MQQNFVTVLHCALAVVQGLPDARDWSASGPFILLYVPMNDFLAVMQTLPDFARLGVHKLLLLVVGAQDCVAAQIASPILIELHACLDDTQQLVASCAAIHQFQKLVDMIAGPREQQRWLELQQRLQVYHCSDSNSIDSGGRCTACGSDLTQGSVALSAASETASADGQVTAATRQMQDNTVSDVLFDIAAQQPLLAQQLQQPQPLQTYRQPERMRHLDKLTDQQRAILGLGDALEAITVTANGNAVRYCEQQGVKLEVLMHRPVWLTGL